MRAPSMKVSEAQAALRHFLLVEQPKILEEIGDDEQKYEEQEEQEQKLWDELYTATKEEV
jgi:hypothetical protein